MILANDNIQFHTGQRGVLRVFVKTVEALAEHYGPSVLLCSPRRYPQLKVKHCRIPRVPGHLGARIHSFLPTHDRLVSLVAALERPDVIYSAYYGSLATQAPHVVTVFDMTFERFPEYFPRRDPRVSRQIAAKRRCLEQSALILAISEATAQDLRAVYPQIDPARIVTIPLGVEEIFFSRPLPFSAQRPYFLFAGNRDLYKNFPALVQAYAQSGLADRYDLRAFSPGPPAFKPAEQALIRRYGLEIRVHLTANPSDEEVRDLYAGSTALIYPSLFEGFGFPVLEAMACGTVVATSKTSSLPEVGGDVAFYFDPGSVDSITAAMIRVSELSDAQRRDLITRGRDRSRLFTWERFKARTVEAFHALVEAVLQMG